jgi:hypothetical protein
MGNDPREWVAVRTSGWWCEEPGLWDTPLRCVSLQPPATPSTVYAWDHRNRLIGVTEFDDDENILSEVKHEYDLFNRLIRRSVDPDGPGGAPAVDTYFSWFEGQVTLQFEGTTASDLGHRYFWNPAAVEQIRENSSRSNASFGWSMAELWSCSCQRASLPLAPGGFHWPSRRAKERIVPVHRFLTLQGEYRQALTCSEIVQPTPMTRLAGRWLWRIPLAIGPRISIMRKVKSPRA